MNIDLYNTRYKECEKCGERFWGDAIKTYLVETISSVPLCRSCAKEENPKEKSREEETLGSSE